MDEIPRYNVIFDMETGDPDDLFTLCFLLAHPKVELRSISITPEQQNKWD